MESQTKPLQEVKTYYKKIKYSENRDKCEACIKKEAEQKSKVNVTYVTSWQ